MDLLTAFNGIKQREINNIYLLRLSTLSIDINVDNLSFDELCKQLSEKQKRSKNWEIIEKINNFWRQESRNRSCRQFLILCDFI